MSKSFSSSMIFSCTPVPLISHYRPVPTNLSAKMSLTQMDLSRVTSSGSRTLNAVHKLRRKKKKKKKMLAPWKKSYDKPRQCIKKRDITFPTKVSIAKARVFPVVTYRCKSWTIKKAESQKTDAFKL